jgi:hypothetical protein
MKLLLSSLLGFAVLMGNPVFAKGMNKCVVDGKVIYSVKNCVDKKSQTKMDKGTFSNISIKGKKRG